MVLRVKPIPTQFPTNNALLHSISNVCHPWGECPRSARERRSSSTFSLCLVVLFILPLCLFIMHAFKCELGRLTNIHLSTVSVSLNFCYTKTAISEMPGYFYSTNSCTINCIHLFMGHHFLPTRDSTHHPSLTNPTI